MVSLDNWIHYVSVSLRKYEFNLSLVLEPAAQGDVVVSQTRL